MKHSLSSEDNFAENVAHLVKSMRILVLLGDNGHHELNGSSSYPAYQMIRNLGNFLIMWALLMLAILLHNY